jgi:hypothetical protein
MFDHAYRIELAHLVFATIGFLFAFWNARDEWADCRNVDLDHDNVRPVLRVYELSIVAIFMAMFQFISLAVAIVVVNSPPPPLPAVAGLAGQDQFIDLLRAVAVIYGGLFCMTVLALVKSLIRRFMRHRLLMAPPPSVLAATREES